MEENKKITLTLELTPTEYRKIERKSIYNNCTIDEYVKNTILGKSLRGEAEKRTETIKARVTPTELEYIENKKKGTNYTMSDYIRGAVLDKDILVVEGIEELAKQLRGVGKNLNQLVILSHKGLIKKPNIGKVEEKINQIWNILNIIMTIKSR